MKKKLYFFAVSMCLLMACGNSSSKNEEEKEIISVIGTDGKVFTSYQEACTTRDFEAAHAFLDKIMNSEVGYNKPFKYSFDKEKAYYEGKKYVLNKEVEFLVSQNSAEANNRLIFLLNEDASPTPVAEGEILYYEYPDDSRYIEDNQSRFDEYGKWLNDRNSLCDKIIDCCILFNNIDLANKIILMYRPDAVTVKKDLGKGGWDRRAHFTDDSKNRAMKRLQDAIKSGAFKE